MNIYQRIPLDIYSLILAILVLVGIACGQSKTHQKVSFPRKNSVICTVALPKRLRYRFDQKSCFLHAMLFCHTTNESRVYPHLSLFKC